MKTKRFPRNKNGCISAENSRILDNFVDQNVFMCASQLVDDLMKAELITYEDIENLYMTDDEILDAGYESIEKCRDNGEDIQEIYEYWFVSHWLYEELKKRNEPVIETNYGWLWGRTCTGQMISMDSVIENIYINL